MTYFIVGGVIVFLVSALGAWLQANSPVDLGCLPFVGIVAGVSAALFGLGGMLLS